MSRVDATLGLNSAPFRKGIEQAKGSMASFSANVSKGMNALGGVLGAAAVTAGVRQILDEFGRLDDISQRFGVSAETLQRVGYAATLSGASMEQVASAMGRANKAAQDAVGGNEKLQETFRRLGLDVKEFAAMDQEAQFLALADAMQSAVNPNQTLADLQAVMGRAVGELVPLLNQGAEGIRKMGEAASVTSDQTVKMLAAQGDLVDALTQRIKTYSAVLVAYLGTALIGLWDATKRVGEGFAALISGDFKHAMATFTGDAMDAAMRQFREAQEAAVAKVRERNAAMFDLEEELTDKVAEESGKRVKTFEDEFRKQQEAYQKAAAKVAEQDRQARRKREQEMMDSNRRMMEERGERAARKLLDKLGIEEGDLESRISALGSALNRPVDSLQAVGLGLAGVNYGGDRTSDQLRLTRESLVRKLDEVKRAIEDQELTIEEADF